MDIDLTRYTPRPADDPGAEPPPLGEKQKLIALVMASAVRTALEDLHGDGEHQITDELMRRINPAVRNAIASMQHAMDNPSKASRAYLDFNIMGIPDYWEEPELTDDYVKVWRLLAEPAAECKRCGREIIERTDGSWTHRCALGGLRRGCYSASFDADGWDESLPRTWKAAPQIKAA
jgi:hypothetical protein